jgi:hypothetical protein
VRPVGGEDVVGLPAEQERVELCDAGDHLLADDLVGHGRLPAAELEAALGVLVRCAGRLRDPVEGREQIDLDDSHGCSLSVEVMS